MSFQSGRIAKTTPTCPPGRRSTPTTLVSHRNRRSRRGAFTSYVGIINVQDTLSPTLKGAPKCSKSQQKLSHDRFTVREAITCVLPARVKYTGHESGRRDRRPRSTDGELNR